MNNNTKVLLIFILAGAILTSPYVLRIFNGNNYMINSESYYNIRTSNIDELQNRNLPFSLLNFINKDNAVVYRIVPLIIGITSLGLSILIMKKHNISDKNITAISLIIISSPIFINTFLDLKYFSFSILLSLLTIYLINIKKRFISIIPLIIIPFVDFYSSIIFFILLFIYLLLTSRKERKNLIILSVAIFSIIIATLLNISTGYAPKIPVEKTRLLTEIGGDAGFSFSIIILYIIGIILLWEKGFKNTLIYTSLILLIILSIFNNTIKAYINFIIAIYAGFAFTYLTKRKWSIQIIKKITLLLIICSIIFTTILYITKISKSEPTPEYVDALKFLEKQSIQKEVILSTPENGYMIEYYARRSVFIDEKTIIYEPERIKIYENITKIRNLETTEKILKEYSIKYIFIDKRFKQKLEEDEGLLFLIENSKKFKEIYTDKEIEVWMYLDTI
ncbi:MAG: hypothetical protein KatS3mg002_0110 [Candidatus Woesearchaeota archaeon]|nr:MAG: hypothetical protein KatS3mg002_0110 [Candidatus Woesearchaeota archaeon]